MRRPRATTPEEIDTTNAAALRAAVLQAAAHGHGTFAVDMTGTRFCDWAGLHVPLGAHRRARAEGGEVLLVIASRAVLRSFTAALDRVIPNSTSLDEALAETPAAAARPPRPDPPGTDPRCADCIGSGVEGIGGRPGMRPSRR